MCVLALVVLAICEIAATLDEHGPGWLTMNLEVAVRPAPS